MKEFFVKIDNYPHMEALWVNASALITVICLGAITMSYGNFDFTARLIATISTCMAGLVCFLAQLKPSLVIKLTAFSFLVDLIFLIG
jgi:hypothetical protein